MKFKSSFNFPHVFYRKSLPFIFFVGSPKMFGTENVTPPTDLGAGRRILCLAKANDEPWAFGLPGRLMTGFLKFPWVLHPRKRTWNLKLSHLEKETHLQKKTSIFGFHFSCWKEASFQDTGTWFDKKHTKKSVEKYEGHPPTGEICRARFWGHNFVVVSPSGKLMTLQKSWYEKTLQSSDFSPIESHPWKHFKGCH